MVLLESPGFHQELFVLEVNLVGNETNFMLEEKMKRWRQGAGRRVGHSFIRTFPLEWTAFAILAMFLPSSYEASDF